MRQRMAHLRRCRVEPSALRESRGVPSPDAAGHTEFEGRARMSVRGGASQPLRKLRPEDVSTPLPARNVMASRYCDSDVPGLRSDAVPARRLFEICEDHRVRPSRACPGSVLRARSLLSAASCSSRSAFDAVSRNRLSVQVERRERDLGLVVAGRRRPSRAKSEPPPRLVRHARRSTGRARAPPD